MLTWTRTANIAHGKLGPALAWAHEAATYAKGKTGIDIKVELAWSGNPHRIRWVGQTEGFAVFEQAMNKALADPKYVDLLAKAGDLFVGFDLDEFWMTA